MWTEEANFTGDPARYIELSNLRIFFLSVLGIELRLPAYQADSLSLEPL